MIKPVELEMVDCVGRGDFANLKHLLSEGVSPNILGGSLPLEAAQYGETKMLRLLLECGASIPRSREAPLLGAAVASAAPETLQTVIDALGQEATEKALRRNDYAIIVLAGDVCRKAKCYDTKATKLTLAEVDRRRAELLGNAVRVAVWKLDEHLDFVWRAISERSRHCATILRDVFEPTSERDMQILEEWLKPHLD